MYFLYHTLIFVVLNYKVLANFSSGYPLTITRDFPVHNTFCWVFPIRDASLTCPGVTVLFKKIRGNLKNFAIQLGDQVEEERNARRWHSLHLQTCVCVLLSIGGGTATISILNQECVLVSIFGCGATIFIFNCMCAHVHAWRWHSDTATISILNCVCVLCPCLSPP